MSLDLETVKRIGKLARLKVPDDQAETVRTNLNHIMDFIGQLSEVNTDGVEPMVGTGAKEMPFRQDAITDGNYVGAIVANAPEVAANMFVVPKVVE